MLLSMEAILESWIYPSSDTNLSAPISRVPRCTMLNGLALQGIYHAAYVMNLDEVGPLRHSSGRTSFRSNLEGISREQLKQVSFNYNLNRQQISNQELQDFLGFVSFPNTRPDPRDIIHLTEN